LATPIHSHTLLWLFFVPCDIVCYALLQCMTSVTFYFFILNFLILNLVDCCVVVMRLG